MTNHKEHTQMTRKMLANIGMLATLLTLMAAAFAHVALAQERPVVLRVSTYLDGRGHQQSNASIVIEHGKIVTVNSSEAAPAGATAALSARIHIGPEIDYLERAFDASKYGEFSPAPYLEASIPSLLDPSLAPQGKHVMTIHMQYAPYKVNAHSSLTNCHSERMRLASSEEPAFRPAASDQVGFSGGRGFSSDKTDSSSSRASAPEACPPGRGASPQNWPSQRDALADAVIRTLAEYAPDLPSKILARRVITPLDLEADYGLTGGHISHGELALDQLFTMRPLLGFTRYATPIRGLFLCGSGTHPGIALAGASALNASRQILRALRSQPRRTI
jgi:phytoene dehydrogenase-like protein